MICVEPYLIVSLTKLRWGTWWANTINGVTLCYPILQDGGTNRWKINTGRYGKTQYVFIYLYGSLNGLQLQLWHHHTFARNFFVTSSKILRLETNTQDGVSVHVMLLHQHNSDTPSRFENLVCETLLSQSIPGSTHHLIHKKPDLDGEKWTDLPRHLD